MTPDSLATLIYTSGTTGRSKGVMITHRNVRYEQDASLRLNPYADQVGADGVARIVTYLPMAHVTGRTLDHWGPMAHPVTLAYCPDHLRLFEIAAQVHPTFLMGIPRVWEKLHAALRGALPDVSPAAVRALPDGVKQAVLGRIGLDQCRIAATGSAPIDPEIVEFFRALGVPLTEGWGMSELSNAATFAAPDEARPGAVGRAFPGVEVRLADDGEVLVRGPLVMGGYYKDPELTMATIDADGWLATGDIGEFDADGFLKIIDRKKELDHHFRRQERLARPGGVRAAAAPADRPGLRDRRPAQLRDRAARARPGDDPGLGAGARHRVRLAGRPRGAPRGPRRGRARRRGGELELVQA